MAGQPVSSHVQGRVLRKVDCDVPKLVAMFVGNFSWVICGLHPAHSQSVHISIPEQVTCHSVLLAKNIA